ncbi:MAG: hypothetical protein RL213_1980 [Bacteroidota bacterium]|jgi:uncharacterized protein involved in outer membrane biogenesis
MRILRRLRMLLLVLASLIALLLLCAVVITVFYKDEVQQLVIRQLNRHLKTEISVDEFDISLLRHFPYASLDMGNVLMKEVSATSPKDTLLYAKRISLLFNVMSFYRKDYTIKRIVVTQGVAKILVRKDGSNNYEFWTSDTASAGTELDLSRVDLERVQVSYRDKRHPQDYEVFLKKVRFSGSFGEKRFGMHVSGELFAERISVEGVDYLRSKEVILETGLDVDTEQGHFVLQESELQLAGVDFSVSGDFTSKKKETGIHLRINAREADLASFIRLLPDRYASRFNDYRSSGKFEFSARINGTSSADSKPVVSASFRIKDGELTPPGRDISLHHIMLSGEFSGKGEGTLHIPGFEAVLGKQPVKGDLLVKDFSSPYLEMHAQSTLELADLGAFLAADSIQDLSGQASLNIAFAGKVSELHGVRSGEMQNINSSGAVRLRDMNFRIKDNPLAFTSVSGDLELQNTDVRVRDLKGNVSSSDFLFNGTFENLIPFLLSPHHQTRISASLSSNSIDLDELLTNESASTEEDTSYKLAVDPRLTCDLEVHTGRIKFRQFRAAALSGNVHLERQVLTGQGLRFKAMEGELLMDALIDVSGKDSVRMSCDATLKKIDVGQLFRQIENFGQDVMTDKHVKGDLSAGIRLRSSWTKDLHINPASVKATCDITIENGRLTGFKPILALSKYIRLADLNDIRFSTLHNVISIADRKIVIPTMEIHSSALDLSANGVHDFDNNIDYHFRILLADVLGRKYKEQQTEFGTVEDDGLGRTKLFLSMTGTVDDPKISYDRKAVKEQLKEDFTREKEVVKDLLRKEFGSGRKDSVKKAVQPAKKKEELEIEY